MNNLKYTVWIACCRHARAADRVDGSLDSIRVDSEFSFSNSILRDLKVERNLSRKPRALQATPDHKGWLMRPRAKSGLSALNSITACVCPWPCLDAWVDLWRHRHSSVLYSWPRWKQWSIKINYLYVLTCPLGQKFHTDSKHDLKKFHTITEGYNFFD